MCIVPSAKPGSIFSPGAANASVARRIRPADGYCAAIHTAALRRGAFVAVSHPYSLSRRPQDRGVYTERSERADAAGVRLSCLHLTQAQVATRPGRHACTCASAGERCHGKKTKTHQTAPSRRCACVRACAAPTQQEKGENKNG